MQNWAPFLDIEIDLEELDEFVAEPGYGNVTLELTPEGDGAPIMIEPWHTSVDSEEQMLDMYVQLVPGRYRVVYADCLLGSVELEHGTTLRLRPQSQEFEAEWILGGAPAGPAFVQDRLDLRNLDTEDLRSYYGDLVVEPGVDALGPGRYELIYNGSDHHELDSADGFPDNRGAVLGCITVEID